jgi:hypothetical protein
MAQRIITVPLATRDVFRQWYKVYRETLWQRDKDRFANQGYVKALWLTRDPLRMFDPGNSYRRINTGDPYTLTQGIITD